jgi:hypothetical protein
VILVEMLNDELQFFLEGFKVIVVANRLERGSSGDEFQFGEILTDEVKPG